MKTLTVGKHERAILFSRAIPVLLSPTVGVGVGVGAGAGAKICLKLEPEPEISKIGGSGDHAIMVFINGLTDSE